MIKIRYKYDKAELKRYADESVFDEKSYRYIPRKKLLKKTISREANAVSATLVFFILLQITVLLFFEVFQYILFMNGKYLNANTVDFNYAISAAATSLGLALPFIFYFKISNQNPYKLIKFKKTDSTAPLFIIAGLGLGFLANIPVNLLSYLLEDSTYINFDLVESTMPSSFGGYVLMFFAVAIIPAFIEEFALRGVFLGKLRKYGDLFAIVTSSFIFALLHQNLPSILVTFVSGCIMGWIYVKTNNLWPSIIVHFLNNSFSLIMLMAIDTYGEGTVGTIITCILFYIPIVLALIALYILSKKRDYLFEFTNNYPYVSGWSKFKSAILNPCSLLVIFYCLYASIVTMFWV